MITGAIGSILDAIGGTPLVRLNRIAADVPARVHVKCEYLNPAGSAMDRLALHLVNQAETRGDLAPGHTIIAATTGNTGASLAMVCATRGYPCVFVVPDGVAEEKVAALRAYGARVVVCPAAVEPDDPRSFHAVAKRLAADIPNGFLADQYTSPDNPEAHHASTGPEIWEQTGGDIDVFVAGLGTGGTMMGVGRFLRERKPDIKLVGVDPVGSVYYDFAKFGRVAKPLTYKLEGLGQDFFPPTLDLGLLDEVVRVDDRDAFLTTRALVRLEGIHAGGSSGAAVAGALQYARRTGAEGNIVVLLPDGAARYLSKIFNDDWMRENGFLAEEEGLGVVADLLQGKSSEVIIAKSTDRVRDVISRMKAHGISQLPVLEDGRLIGAVAEVDLLRYLVSGEQSLASPIGPIVESDYATVSVGTRIDELQGLLADARMAIVMDGERVSGVVTKIDLIDYLARRAS